VLVAALDRAFACGLRRGPSHRAIIRTSSGTKRRCRQSAQAHREAGEGAGGLIQRQHSRRAEAVRSHAGGQTAGTPASDAEAAQEPGREGGYKGKAVDAKQIGRELGVRYLLEGGVQHAGDRFRINLQLVEAQSGTHLWAERFDRNRGDLFENA
jgi:hypothetical protein